MCFEDAGVEADGDDVVVGTAGGDETALTGRESDGVGHSLLVAEHLDGLFAVAQRYLAFAADAHRDDEGVVFLQLAMESLRPS